MFHHKIHLFLILIFLIVLQGCKPNGDGFAPNLSEPSPNLSKKLTTLGQSMRTSNGWSIDENHNQFIQRKTLTNNWTVEVQYE